VGLVPKLVVSILGSDTREIEDSAREAWRSGADLVEIRLDYVTDIRGLMESRYLKSSEEKLVLTYRSKDEGGKGEFDKNIVDDLKDVYYRFSKSLVDLEFFKIKSNPLIARVAESLKPRLIVSWHTSSLNIRELVEVYRRATTLGKYVKIVTKAEDYEDNIRVLRLYDLVGADNLIAFCMGYKWVLSRVLRD
jgi:3-dehydroquinate dehydratase type I